MLHVCLLKTKALTASIEQKHSAINEPNVKNLSLKSGFLIKSVKTPLKNRIKIPIKKLSIYPL